jgi:hypothetical protein
VPNSPMAVVGLGASLKRYAPKSSAFSFVTSNMWCASKVPPKNSGYVEYLGVPTSSVDLGPVCHPVVAPYARLAWHKKDGQHISSFPRRY